MIIIVMHLSLPIMFKKRTDIQSISFISCCLTCKHIQTQSLYVFFKYSALEQHGAAVREKLERRVTELQKKVTQQKVDTAAEVRFHTRSVHTMDQCHDSAAN